MAPPAPLHSLPAHLLSTKAPWISLLVLKKGQRAESLVTVPSGFVSTIIRGDKCRTSTGLFSEFARAMEFPKYFGHNWDALEECLADLEWLPARGYVLIFTDAEQVLPDDEEDYATFLEVLSDAGEAWGSGNAGMGEQRPTPFHALLAVSVGEKSKRAHWTIQEITPPPPRASKLRGQPSQSKASRRQKGR